MIVSREKKKKKPSRYTTLLVIMSLIFTIIIVRLLYIQVYKYEDYQDKANTTATKFMSEKAPRGIIYDKNGNILATNEQTYAITYTSAEAADKAFYKTVDELSKILSESKEKVQDDLILKLSDNNEPYFDYKSTTTSGKEAEEIRFKRDRGLNVAIEKDLYDEDEIEDLSESQIDKVNQELLNISPKEVFYNLVKSYDLISLVDPLPPKEETKAYKAKAQEHKDMTGEESTTILAETYSYAQLRNYIVIKDAIKMQSFKGYKSVTLASNIQKNTYLIIAQKRNDLPGIDVTLEPTRYYPYKELASSVLGYISPIDQSNKEKYELRGYDASTDLIGVSGIEAALEDQLKGAKGGTTVKVNSKGGITETLFQLESYPGNSVHLTIDKNIQWVAEHALADTMINIQKTTDEKNRQFIGANRGATVVVDVNTGKILASVSYPNYNPNEFVVSGKLTKEQTNQFFSPDLEAFGKEYIRVRGLNKTIDELFPISDGVRTDPYDLYPRSFYNYASQGLVPPGSTFKALTAIAALESNAMTTTETVFDDGKFDEHKDLYNSSNAPKCWLVGGHGPVSVEKALQVSCNYYFYEAAYKLYKQTGLNALASYAWKFGLGSDPNGQQKASTGIEIEENFGQVYNFQSWKNRSIATSKYDIRNFLELGNYNDSKFFVPFDYSDNEDDSEKLKEAKTALKTKITERFNKIATDGEKSDIDAFAKTILDDVKKIMEISPKYKENVQKYESDGKGTVNVDKQASTVSLAISTFVTSDRRAEIISPAQEIIAAIGQGMNQFTPMQLAQYVSTIANGGTRYSLHYVDKVTNPDGEVIKEYTPEVLDTLKISDSTMQAVKRGMEKVNNDEDGGTAVAAWNGFPIDTAGKTGTADFNEKQDELGRAPFATYISFAPADKPEIAVVTVVYDAGHGGTVAPVARAIYEAYFKERILLDNPRYTSESFEKYIKGVPLDNKVTK